MTPFQAVLEESFRINKKHTAIQVGAISYTYDALRFDVGVVLENLKRLDVNENTVCNLSGPLSYKFIAILIALHYRNAIVHIIDGEENALDRMMIETKLNIKCQVLDIYFSARVDVGERHGVDADELFAVNQAVSEPFKLDIRGDDPAYIIKTSGSTGEPKYILGKTGSLCHFSMWLRDEYLTANSKVICLLGITFDGIYRALLSTLFAGASVHIPEKPTPITSRENLALIAKCNINIIHATPTTINRCISQIDSRLSVFSAPIILLGGEAVTVELASRLKDVFGHDARVINLYGATETTNAKTYYEYGSSYIGEGDGCLPAGTPIPECSIVIGISDKTKYAKSNEICIITRHAALGYLPKSLPLNKLAFDMSGEEVVYYTGDHGYIDDFNQLRVLGRLDYTVKVAGKFLGFSDIEGMIGECLMQNTLIKIVKELRDLNSGLNVVIDAVSISSDQYLSIKALMLDDIGFSKFNLYLLPNFPLLPSGKVNIEQIAEKIKAGAQLYGLHNKVMLQEKKALLDILKKFRITQININHRLGDMGISSLKSVAIYDEINSLLCNEVEYEIMFNTMTIGDLDVHLNTLEFLK
ncbi:AMP-binding protein [Pseudomonas sp.]|uniref:AMP-binding protein n=1 Tax=Pseudomonas sp. TaxID=306 RepID=UPI003C771D6F